MRSSFLPGYLLLVAFCLSPAVVSASGVNIKDSNKPIEVATIALNRLLFDRYRDYSIKLLNDREFPDVSGIRTVRVDDIVLKYPLRRTGVPVIIERLDGYKSRRVVWFEVRVIKNVVASNRDIAYGEMITSLDTHQVETDISGLRHEPAMIGAGSAFCVKRNAGKGSIITEDMVTGCDVGINKPITVLYRKDGIEVSRSGVTQGYALASGRIPVQVGDVELMAVLNEKDEAEIR